MEDFIYLSDDDSDKFAKKSSGSLGLVDRLAVLDNDPYSFEDSESDDDIAEIDSEKDPSYNPQLNSLNSYKGPYPIDSLMRVRKRIIRYMKPKTYNKNATRSYTNIAEIIRLKCNIKSIYDNDQKLIDMIKRDKIIAKYHIADKITLIKRELDTLESSKTAQMTSRNKIIQGAKQNIDRFIPCITLSDDDTPS